MDDTDPAKLEAALEQLEIEKARRRQAKIDAGEMVSIQTSSSWPPPTKTKTWRTPLPGR